MKKITCNDGKEIIRISRWIKVNTEFDITPKHSLFYYADKLGEKENYIDYFRFDGKKYALNQFFRCGSMFLNASYNWTEKDGLHFISGVDMGSDLYDPIMIELSECGEAVRVYKVA